MGSSKARRMKIGNEELLAQEIDFDIVSENWNEYKLSNGIKVRVKNTVVKFFVAVNDEGEIVYDENGDPRVIVNGNLNVVASPGE